MAIIKTPGASEVAIESLKQLVGDIAEKSEVERDWMKTAFLSHLVRVVALGVDPEESFPGEPPNLGGYPARVLMKVLPVVALTEHRKYKRSEPFGGKYLLVRVCAGLTWGVWSPDDVTTAL